MRKFLSLLLALVMVVSLFTMTTTAGASDFTDDDSITYQEAIDVISAIGVVDGYSDGSFRPTTQLNRGQAAKIITNMVLGPTAANALATSAAPFKDVPANHIFAGHIAYCAQQGIINGYGDGTFKPGGNLSGYAFLKMLLGALGYDGSIEGFTGPNWTINVAKLANGVGLLADVADGFSGTATIDRQTACLFAFNTLSSDLVVYNQFLVGAGNTVTSHGTTATPKYWNSQSSTISGNNIVNDNIVQFGEEYFSRLVRNQGNFTWWDKWDSNYNTDAMGRPASTWTYRGENIGTYTLEADKTYVGDVKLNEIYTDLGMNTGNNNIDHGTTTIIINGKPYASEVKSKTTLNVSTTGRIGNGTNVKRNTGAKVGDYTKGYDWWLFATDGQKKQTGGWKFNDYTVTIDTNAFYGSATIKVPSYVEVKDDDIYQSAVGATAYKKTADEYDINEKKVGNGTRIEVYRNDKTNDVVIAVISVYGGKVTAVRPGTARRDDYVEIEYGSDPHHRPVNFNRGGDIANWFATTGFKVDDVVAYTFSDKEDEIQTMETIKSVEGSLAKKVVEKNMTLGETTYKYANEYNFEFGLSEEDLTHGSNYRVFQDEDGNALWIEEAAFNLMDYALIERISCETNDVARNTVISHSIDDMIHNGTVKGVDGDAPRGFDPTNTAKQPFAPYYDGTNTSSIWDGNRAKLLRADGTEETVTLDKSYVENVNGQKRFGAVKDYDATRVDGSAPSQTLQFWAGDIVRTTKLANGTVRLTPVTQLNIKRIDPQNETEHAWFFGAYDGTKSGNPANPATLGFMTIKDRRVRVDIGNPDPVEINTDSNTVFVVRVKDSAGRQTWKVYTGIMNAPTVEEGVGFAYMKTNLAKIIFVTDGTIRNISKDVTFVALSSASKLNKESDTNEYYVYNAVVRGEITTLKIAHDAAVRDTGLTNELIGGDFTPGKDETKGTWSGDLTGTKLPGVIANNYISDVDSLISRLTFDRNNSSAYVQHGLKVVSDREITVGTIDPAHKNEKRGMTLPVADSVKVFLIDDDGDIEEVTMSDLYTSYNRIVFYTLDDGQVNNLFVVETTERW